MRLHKNTESWFATIPEKCGKIVDYNHYMSSHCGLEKGHAGDHDECLHRVDITIDRNICGWFAICYLCRGTKITEGGYPRDVEKAIRRHINAYHDSTATYGYYRDGARHD